MSKEGGKSRLDTSLEKQSRKRRRKDGEARAHVKKWAKATSRGKEVKGNLVMNVDQLAWKKISLQNDEFDDFEEIEGVDVEHVDRDGNKVIQFKVGIVLGMVTNLRLWPVMQNHRQRRL